MTNIAVILVALVILGMVARSYNWRVRAAIFVLLTVMIIILIQ